ncbi:TPA: hypothetical protein DDZ10_00485 [Candidatus Uhrbacteria bacterium]|nr:hypothetical protein [Candidatus Uhrbacteria bacterium]
MGPVVQVLLVLILVRWPVFQRQRVPADHVETEIMMEFLMVKTIVLILQEPTKRDVNKKQMK